MFLLVFWLCLLNCLVIHVVTGAPFSQLTQVKQQFVVVDFVVAFVDDFVDDFDDFVGDFVVGFVDNFVDDFVEVESLDLDGYDY